MKHLQLLPSQLRISLLPFSREGDNFMNIMDIMKVRTVSSNLDADGGSFKSGGLKPPSPW